MKTYQLSLFKALKESNKKEEVNEQVFILAQKLARKAILYKALYCKNRAMANSMKTGINFANKALTIVYNL